MSSTGPAIRVRMTRVSDGHVVEWTDDPVAWWLGADVAHAAEFMYSEGNYRCDCNRKIFFHRHGFGVELDDAATPCGDGGYTVTVWVDDVIVHDEHGVAP